jgi:hypothetical protein
MSSRASSGARGGEDLGRRGGVGGRILGGGELRREKPGWLMAGWRRMGLGAVVRVVRSEATTPTERSGVLAWREIGEKARERSSRLIVSRHFHPR